MSHLAYFDNSATTAPCKTAVERMTFSLTENWGNPSSLHTVGIRAEETADACKTVCAKLLSCHTDEIFFTGSGTEANNLAIQGAVRARAKRGRRIVTTAIEHPSVYETVRFFENEGFEVVCLTPGADGVIQTEDLQKAITPDTILVSMMLVNNETGAIQPVAAAAEAIRQAGAPALLHCDAVQGFGKLTVKPTKLGIDLMTASGHKIHGPKGIGLLYKKKGVHIAPVLFGGGQQEGIRPGTEPMPLIAGLLGAIEELPDLDKQMKITEALRDYTRDRLLATGAVQVNSSPDALPYILNISVPGFRSETLLHFLDAKGICVSSGSACSKGKVSHTLSALGLSADRVDSALRISFSRFNTKEEADRLAAGIAEAVTKLKRK